MILGKSPGIWSPRSPRICCVFICSIHEEIPKNRQKRPVTLMVPVNLRNFFPSESMANFFGWIEVGYTFTETTTFQDVLEDVKKQFEEELVKEKIAMHMNGYVRLEKNPLIRAVPLEVKKYFLMVGAAWGSRRITTVYSNIGVVRFPKEYEPYIQRFGFFTCTEALQLCSCSYGDELLLGFTSKIPGESIQRNFLRYLREDKISFKEERNDFPCQRNRAGGKKLPDFSFLCSRRVICGMVNYMIWDTLNWFWLARAGSFCAWLGRRIYQTEKHFEE